MSGVTALFYLDGHPVQPAQIEEMTDILAHRGPDGRGVWYRENVGLGHRMLHVTPESLHEPLPLRDDSADLTITADMRLDNREELIRELGIQDAAAGDAALILAAYRKWGEECPAHLLGDFAFCIWDERRQQLFCARDHMGARSLYYHYVPSRLFCIATEIKALLTLPEVPRRIDEQRVSDHFTALFQDKVLTFYRDIKRLEPAHSLVIKRDGAVFKKYWEPDLTRELRFKSDADAEEQFRELLKEAVRCRMRSAFTVGSMLSGGLDSSATACLARDQMPTGQTTLPTFSAIWPSLHDIDPRCNEMPFIQSVLDTGKFDPHYIHADELSPLTDIDRMQWNQDDALPAPNLYMDWAVYKRANAEGTRVLFSGTDGDSTVSYGYEDFREFARRGWWKTLYQEASLLRKNMPAWNHTRKNMIWDYGFESILPQWILGLKKVAQDPQYKRPGDILLPDFAERMNVLAQQNFYDNGEDRRPSKNQSRIRHWEGIGSGLFSYALESLGKAAGTFAVEPVYPFFDIRLIQFCISLPPHQKMKNGWTRSIFRRAMAGLVPDPVRWRAKKGMIGANFRLKLRDWDRKYLDAAILEHPEVLDGWVDQDALRALYDHYTTSDFAQDDEAFSILMPVTLSHFIRSREISRE